MKSSQKACLNDEDKKLDSTTVETPEIKFAQSVTLIPCTLIAFSFPMQPDSRNFLETRSHTETHLTSSAVLQDIVIGLSDGLTVPFAQRLHLSR